MLGLKTKLLQRELTFLDSNNKEIKKKEVVKFKKVVKDPEEGNQSMKKL